MKRKTVLKNEKGFTLTEMLIVVAIIGLVMTLAAQQIMSRFAKARVDSTKIQMKSLGSILDTFRIDCGTYPTTDQGLASLIAKPTTGRECKNYDPNGYIRDKKVPKDAWGADFIYESDGQKFAIKSLGSDGVEGGEGDGKDLSSDDL